MNIFPALPIVCLIFLHSIYLCLTHIFTYTYIFYICTYFTYTYKIFYLFISFIFWFFFSSMEYILQGQNFLSVSFNTGKMCDGKYYSIMQCRCKSQTWLGKCESPESFRGGYAVSHRSLIISQKGIQDTSVRIIGRHSIGWSLVPCHVFYSENSLMYVYSSTARALAQKPE